MLRSALPLFFLLFQAFPGYSRPALENIMASDTIVIGLLVETTKKGQEAISACRLAIDQANKNTNGKKLWFKLAYRSTAGSWGQASNKAVELIFSEQVVAIVGSLDGRTAHLTEQVTTKSHVPYLETKATDPTLSKAYVPWFFRLIPNDDQIARAIAEDIFVKKKYSNVAVISSDAYDSDMAFSAFKKVIGDKYPVKADYFVINSKKPDFGDLINSLNEKSYDAIVLFNQADNQQAPLTQFLSISDASIYHNLLLTGPEANSLNYPFYGISLAGNPANYNKFKDEFQKYGPLPATANAAAIYDAVNLIIKMDINGSDKPEIIGRHIGDQGIYKGVSGDIEFDNLGNLTREVQLILVK